MWLVTLSSYINLCHDISFWQFLWFLAPPGMVTSMTKSRVMGGVAGSWALGTAETIISGLPGTLDGTCLQRAVCLHFAPEAECSMMTNFFKVPLVKFRIYCTSGWGPLGSCGWNHVSKVQDTWPRSQEHSCSFHWCRHYTYFQPFFSFLDYRSSSLLHSR